VKRRGETLDPAAIDGADVVIHLAGAGVADERWTPERKRLLVDSRVAYTRDVTMTQSSLLVDDFSSCEAPTASVQCAPDRLLADPVDRRVPA
jgi:hypothetical protein